MSPLNPTNSTKLAELQDLCDECKTSIEAHSDDFLKEAMQRTCEKCAEVRQRLPDLMALRLRIGALKTA